MTDLFNKFSENFKLQKQRLVETEMTMNVELVLIVLVVALMVLIIISFVCFLVALRCQKRKKDQYSDWIRSASIEHLRFTPAEREAHRMRTSTPIDCTPVPSTPYNMELPTYENFIGSRCNNYLGNLSYLSISKIIKSFLFFDRNNSNS